MRLISSLLLATLAAAAPSDLDEARLLWSRQAKDGGNTANDLEQGPCKGSTFIWARGTMEPGNMGWIIGNYLTPLLKKGLNGDIAVQGVKYGADLLTNIGPGMADPKGVSESTRLINLAIKKCPGIVVTGGGYSQGAAVMHRTVEKLSEDVKGKIAAMLLYGDTQYPSDKDSIKGFPKDKVKVICKPDDGVCTGYITVTPGHLAYSDKAAEGANWLIKKIQNAKGRSAGGAPGAEAALEPEPMADMDMGPPKAAKGSKGAGGAGAAGGKAGGAGGAGGAGAKAGGGKGKGGKGAMMKHVVESESTAVEEFAVDTPVERVVETETIQSEEIETVESVEADYAEE